MGSAEEIEGSEDLLTKILLGLPAKTVFRFKSVSKRWNSSISARYFASQYEPTVSGHFVQLPHVDSMYKNIHEYIPLNSGNLLMKIDHTYDHSATALVDSRGGLFLCCSKSPGRWGRDYYVCNHTTKRFTVLPDPGPRTLIIVGGDLENRCLIDTSHLVYDLSSSPHYKVILFRIKPVNRVTPMHLTFQVRIYSSETKCWAPWGPDFDIPHIKFQYGVFLNNVVHWPSIKSGVSLYYDVNGERFHSFPMPLMNNGRTCREIKYFGEAKGSLVMIVPTVDSSHYNGYIYHAESWNSSYDIHELEKDYSSWSMKYRVDLDVIATKVGTRQLSLMCALGQEDEEDSFLVLYAADMVISYKPKDGTFKKVYDLDKANSQALSRLHVFGKHYQFVENPFALP